MWLVPVWLSSLFNHVHVADVAGVVEVAGVVFVIGATGSCTGSRTDTNDAHDSASWCETPLGYLFPTHSGTPLEHWPLSAIFAQHNSAAYVQWTQIAELSRSCKKAAEASRGSERQMGFQNNADQKHGAQPRPAAYRDNDVIALLLLGLSLIVHCSEKYRSRSRPREMRVCLVAVEFPRADQIL